MATSSLVVELQRELQSIDSTLKNIEGLRVRRQKVEGLLREYKGFGLMQGGATPAKKGPAKKSAKPAKKAAPKKASPKKAPKKAETQLQVPGVNRLPAREPMTTMDMARQILNNSGQPMKPGDIHKQIVSVFGAAPAATLTQMLYKRSRAGSTFYRTAEGNYGLLAWQGGGEGQKAA